MMLRFQNQIVFSVPLLALVALSVAQTEIRAEDKRPYEEVVAQFVSLLTADEAGRKGALEYIDKNWNTGFLPMALETVYLTRDPGMAAQLIGLMEKNTKESFRYDLNAWYRWLWDQPASDHAQYADFKAALYSLIDQRFEQYFDNERTSNIRLDEVRWGGVRQDGIPPLRSPEMIDADAADYLGDNNIVFGLEVNGDVRAYPKRILAWHEMFTDEVGGIPVAGVYCTLCGTMILYKTTINGVTHKLGTSGFLYRSNKLMYDAATQSLWNTIWGQPVIGPLADEDITLERMYLVTTTWGEWRRRHPETKVLSLATGHRRDYSEGAAYREYFATDDLMFEVSTRDQRLKNKDEILGLVFAQYADQPVAISSAFLAENPVYHDQIGDINFIILTDRSGAHRVYASGDVGFNQWDGDRTAIDNSGTAWQLTENQLTATDGRILNRLPAHRAFWFGWYSAYTRTRLVN
jgi:hypothetical protein